MRPLQAGDLTVLLPAYNEEAALPAVVAALRRTLGPTAEILVVDDGSSDRTAAAAAAAGADVVRHETNRGKGHALRTGLRVASGRLIVTMDADGQDAAADLSALLDAATAGADLVIGSRFLGTFHPGAISRINALATRGFNLIMRALFRRTVTDSQAGFRCFRADLARSLPFQAAEYEVETEMLLLAFLAGAKVVEVPVARFARTSGVSTFRRVRHGLRILRTILRVWRNRKHPVVPQC